VEYISEGGTHISLLCSHAVRLRAIAIMNCWLGLPPSLSPSFRLASTPRRYILYTELNLWHIIVSLGQCCESILMDPGPAIFIIDLQDANKN
jgi:hypothetical protein